MLSVISLITSFVLRQIGALKKIKILKYIFTPLVLISTMGVVATYSTTLGLFGHLIIFGLFFALIGDILLMLEGSKDFFTYGLLAFLVTNILYIIAFATLYTFSASHIFLILFLAFMLLITKLLFKNFESFIYSIFLSVMMFFGVTSGITYIALGSALFYLSDLIIGFDSFSVIDVPDSSFWVWCFYAPSQLLIALALI